MTAATDFPEPLRPFDDAAASLSPALTDLATAHARYLRHRNTGRILPNSVEALRVELTYHSNAIEGSTLTLRETQLILEGHAPTGGKSLREIYEARNHDRALRLVEQWSARSAPLTEQDILAVHAHVLADIDPQNAGRLRAERVLIKGTRFVPPSSHHFERLLPLILERAARANVHPVIQAAELHYNLVALHPFTDGSGRTARLMMNLHLLRHNYPLAIIEVERRADYLAALEDANAGRTEPFAAFILRSMETSITRLLGPA